MVGKIFNIINDVRNYFVVSSLNVIDVMKIGGYIGVLVLLFDGLVYGILCCVFYNFVEWGFKDLKYLLVLVEIVGM